LLVHILTKGFNSPNGASFLFPLLHHRKYLQEIGIKFQLFYQDSSKLKECDIVILESKYYSQRWSIEKNRILEEIKSYKTSSNKVFYFDINDSAGWPHASALPYVDGYFKNQLFKDKTLYTKPLYGHRLYTDYYYRQYQIEDQIPIIQETIPLNDISKLSIGWNSGLGNYSYSGPYLTHFYRYFPWSIFIRYSTNFHSPETIRPRNVSCRMGTQYARHSVAWQRLQIQALLQPYMAIQKVTRRAYYRELKQSKYVISPFGLGEITLKDFETFMAGAVLVKPSLDTMETWPDFYQANKTYVPFKWDLSDLSDLIEKMIANPSLYQDIAKQGQDLYRQYTVGFDAAEYFAHHFTKLLSFNAKENNVTEYLA